MMTTENTKKDTNKEEEAKKKVADDNKNREFLLNKNVSAESVEQIVKGILEINRYDEKQELENKDYVRKPIKVIVDSFGGSIYCGLLLANVIDNSETPVHTYCYSKAMSMGLYIFSLGHVRFASPTATLMYHDAGTTLGDTLEGIQQGINQIKRVVKRMDATIIANSGGKVTQKQLDKIKREKKNWYIFADDALELGLVDKLLESKREKHRKTIDK